MNGMKNQLVERASFLVFLIITCFGIQLFFSENNSLSDPIVNPYYWISKDLFLMSFICFFAYRSLFFYKRIYWHLAMPFMGICVLIFLASLLKVRPIDVENLKVIKNLIFYGLGLTLALPAFFERYDAKRVISDMALALFISIIISMAFYFSNFSPARDDRLYGTFGNPTSMGLGAIMCLAFDFSVRRKIDRKFLAVLFLSTCIIFYAGSFSNALCLLFLFPLVYFYQKFISLYKGCTFAPDYLNTLKKVNLFVPLVFLFFAFTGKYVHSSQLMSRLECIAGACRGEFIDRSNSFTGRLEFLKKLANSVSTPEVFLVGNLNSDYVRIDSTLVSFIYNFGVLSSLLVLFIFAGAVYRGFKNIVLTSSKEDQEFLIGISSLVVTVLIFNLPLQHQFELFPTNILIVGILALVSRNNKKDPSAQN